MNPLTLSKLEGEKVPGKPIKSTDPRKAEIVSMFKAHLGASKVTMLAERTAAPCEQGTLIAKFYAHALVNVSHQIAALPDLTRDIFRTAVCTKSYRELGKFVSVGVWEITVTVELPLRFASGELL